MVSILKSDFSISASYTYLLTSTFLHLSSLCEGRRDNFYSPNSVVRKRLGPKPTVLQWSSNGETQLSVLTQASVLPCSLYLGPAAESICLLKKDRSTATAAFTQMTLNCMYSWETPFSMRQTVWKKWKIIFVHLRSFSNYTLLDWIQKSLSRIGKWAYSCSF